MNGDIQPIPRHEDSCKSDQTSTLLVSIAASIQALSEAVDIVNGRQALFESALKAAGLDITGANAHVTNPIDKEESRSKRVQPTRGWTVAASTQHKLYSLLLPPAMGARFYRFLGRPAKWTRWLAGAAAIKSG